MVSSETSSLFGDETCSCILHRDTEGKKWWGSLMGPLGSGNNRAFYRWTDLFASLESSFVFPELPFRSCAICSKWIALPREKYGSPGSLSGLSLSMKGPRSLLALMPFTLPLLSFSELCHLQLLPCSWVVGGIQAARRWEHPGVKGEG